MRREAPVHAMTATEIGEAVRSRALSAVEVAYAMLGRIERLDGELGAFLQVTPDAALEAARSLDAALARGDELGPLAGVPVAFKDNMDLAGARTTCASRALARYVARESAPCVQSTLDAGAVPLGKLNMDEFAFGSSTESSAFGITRNPWDTSRVPGGSSGGSAAAVAAGLVSVSLGSDAGGSIRQPASFCGVIGVKPSYGMIPRNGIAGFISSLDQAGPLTRSVEDAACCLDVLAGRSAYAPRRFRDALYQDVRGMRIGVIPSFMEARGLSDEVRFAVAGAVARLAEAGAHVVEVDLPHAHAALSAYYVLGPLEVLANLADFDGPGEGGVRAFLAGGLEEGCVPGLGREARRRMMLGAYLALTYEGQDLRRAAVELRRLIECDYGHAFEAVDVIVAPVTPRSAFCLGEVGDPGEMHLSDMFTVSVNVAGNGALSMPIGLGDSTGLPVAVQVISPAGQDEAMLSVAAALERAYGKPPLAPAFFE